MEALGTVKTGTYGVADLFVEQRKYDKDKSKFFIWRERGHAAMVHVLITKLPKVSVSDPEPRHFEDGYRTFQFLSTVDSASSAGALEDQIAFATADANQMQEGDLYKVQADGATSDNWTYISGALGATTIAYGARSATYATEEIIEVLSKAAPGGGNVVVTFRRGVGADTQPATPPNLVLGTKFWHVGEASEDGSGSRVSFAQNAVVVNNYVEIIKVPYEITDITQKVDTFGENEWQRRARNARRDWARRAERMYLSGRMWKRLGADNETIWYSGGLDEWIPNDTDHRINAGRPISQTYMNSVCKEFFMTGSEQKFGFCGYGFLTKLANSAADKIRYNQAMSNDLGFDVNTFTSSGGGTLHLIPDYEMSQMGKDNELYVADAAYLRYMFMEGFDIYINKGKTGAGLQDNDQTKTKHEIYGVIGLKRAFRDTHFQLYGIS